MKKYFKKLKETSKKMVGKVLRYIVTRHVPKLK